MKKSNLRLRLLVRRHNLPEVRLLFSISLQDEPTIADLLEQVNDTVPLESPDWGLDDYVVEIEDSHGHAFECLHFQPVETILDRDEEVVIRPLFTVDRKKRLLSGRHQITSDGKHLVDGVPFGRPRLRVPAGRPPVDIPPLKKRRITFEQEDAADEGEDDDEDYEEDRSEIEDEQDPNLMLTENGEEDDEPNVVRVQAMFDDADNVQDEDEQADDEELDQAEEEEEEEDDLDEEGIGEAELLDELRDLQRDNNMLDDGDPSPYPLPEPAQPPLGAGSDADADLARLNKITALRRAFPAVDCHVYEDVLRRNALNERMAYRELSKSYEASMSLDEMGGLLASFSCPVLPSSNTIDAGAEEEEPGSDAESNRSLVERYDQHGFPSGSILDGSASRAAAEALRKAGHAVKAPVHTRFDDDDAEKADSIAKPQRRKEASKLGTAQAAKVQKPVPGEEPEYSDESDSSSSDSDEDEESDEQDSEDDEDFDDGNESSSTSDSDSTSNDEDESDDSDEADEDSGPEVAPTKPAAQSDPRQRGGSGAEPAKDSSQSKKRKRGPTGTHDPEVESVPGPSSSEESSDSSSESEGDENSSDDSSDDDSGRRTTSTSTVVSAQLPQPEPDSVGIQPQSEATTKRSPPGQGLAKTRARNARRKLALKAKRAAMARSASPQIAAERTEVPSEAHEMNGSEFIQRKQALLEQLAQDNTLAAPPHPQDTPAVGQSDAEHDKMEVPSNLPTPEQLPDPEASISAMASSSQRRSKLDVGAGRRMLFASLGLRNPKTKADEEKIRSDLMKGVRPLVNQRVIEAPPTENGNSDEADPALEEQPDEDPEAWRTKIRYRAVECVQDGVELSEPPFPFVQRWDPQQQNAWRNKRGGRGKRKQRNQGDFYEDDGTLPTAKKQRMGDTGTDTSFAADANDARHQDYELNYDDIPASVSSKIPDEQPDHLTDMDDLPPVPEDLTTLPSLKPSEAKPGLVITWKQMIVSKATKWAPQILDLTAVIVSVDEAAEEFRVVLARRDRHLDGLEKTFDEEGNRVYDRFDAPDDDGDDNGADGDSTEGYRRVQLSDMMDPRIVQQPLPSLQQATRHATVESQDQADVDMAGYAGLANDGVEEETSADVGGHSTHRHQRQEQETDHLEAHAAAPTMGEHDSQDVSSYGSIVPDSVPIAVADAAASVPAENSSNAAQDVSVTDDTRYDISVMIKEAGFRADVTPSIAKETRFSIEELSSPSRQLDEEMSEAAAAEPHQGPGSLAQLQSYHASSALREVIVRSDGAADGQPEAGNEHATPKATVTGDTTSMVAYPQLPQLPIPDSSASSVRSGRQPDNDFSKDWEDDLLHRSEELGEDVGAIDESQSGTNKDEATPTKPASVMGPIADENANHLSSSPFPSLDEIFSEAPVRATQSPSKAKPLDPSKPAAHHDLEYEEIMRRLDGSESWEEDQDQIKAAPASFITPSAQKGVIKEEERSQAVNGKKLTGSRHTSIRKATLYPLSQVLKEEEPASVPRNLRAAARQKWSAIPEGSQVVTLLTSSPEPEVEEHYADDSVDSTYEDSGDDAADRPDGSRWVSEALPGKLKEKGIGGRGKKGVSPSALPAGKSGRQGIKGKGARVRRKTSGKF